MLLDKHFYTSEINVKFTDQTILSIYLNLLTFTDYRVPTKISEKNLGEFIKKKLSARRRKRKIELDVQKECYLNYFGNVFRMWS